MKRLLVEGWRKTSHSYALVNQHQLLQLATDRRLSVFHRDVPLLRPQWEQVDAGFPSEARAILAALSPPPAPGVDFIYRISWPLRVHSGAAERVYVFGTCEVGRLPQGSFCGPNGTDQGVDLEAVEIVTPSYWSKRGLMATGFREERIHVIPHGFDPSLFNSLTPDERQRARAALDIPADAFVFLNIGAMTWNKGIGPLLAAFAHHRRRNPSAILVLKGGEELYGHQLRQSFDEAKKLCPEVGSRDVMTAVRYVPQNLPQSSMAKLYQASDVYLSPYRAEGFNLPVLEALACGTPAIVTAGGSTDDFCPADSVLKVDAELVNVGTVRHLEPSVGSLIDRMQEIADTASARRRRVEEARQWLADRYSWQAVTRSLVDSMVKGG